MKINGEWVKQDAPITANSGYLASASYTVDVSTVSAVIVMFDSVNVTNNSTSLQPQIRVS